MQLQFLHRHQEIGGSLNNRQRESQQESIQYDGNLPVVRGTIRDPPVEKGGGAKRANEGILGSKGFLASLRDLQERCYLSLLTHVFMFLHRSPRVDKITGGGIRHTKYISGLPDMLSFPIGNVFMSARRTALKRRNEAPEIPYFRPYNQKTKC